METKLLGDIKFAGILNLWGNSNEICRQRRQKSNIACRNRVQNQICSNCLKLIDINNYSRSKKRIYLHGGGGVVLNMQGYRGIQLLGAIHTKFACRKTRKSSRVAYRLRNTLSSLSCLGGTFSNPGRTRGYPRQDLGQDQ